jgi:hypothetical protein
MEPACSGYIPKNSSEPIARPCPLNGVTIQFMNLKRGLFQGMLWLAGLTEITDPSFSIVVPAHTFPVFKAG